MLVGDRLRDREPQAGAGAGAAVEANEAPKDPLARVRGHAGPSSETVARTRARDCCTSTRTEPASPPALTALSSRLRRARVSASGSPITIAGPSCSSEMRAGVRERVSATSDR